MPLSSACIGRAFHVRRAVVSRPASTPGVFRFAFFVYFTSLFTISVVIATSRLKRLRNRRYRWRDCSVGFVETLLHIIAISFPALLVTLTRNFRIQKTGPYLQFCSCILQVKFPPPLQFRHARLQKKNARHHTRMRAGRTLSNHWL